MSVARGPEQRSEQPRSPDQGPQTPLETERGSERIWRKHMVFWGGVVVMPALIGSVLGEMARQALGFPQETGIQFSTNGAAIGSIVIGTGLLYLMKRGIVKL